MDDVDKTSVMPVAAAAPQPPHKKGTGAWLWVTIALLVLLVGAGATFALGVFSPASLPQVPDVAGSTVASATQALVKAGYSLGSQLTTASATVANDLVVSTVPTASTQLAKGQLVALVVSTGPATSTAASVPTVSPGAQTGGTGGSGGAGGGGTGTKMVTVPDVTGKHLDYARDYLLALGFVPKLVSQSSSTVPQDDIISQDPSAGRSKPKGSAVTITFSLGPQVTVPNLVGLNEDAALAQLRAIGLVADAHPGDGTHNLSLANTVEDQVETPGSKVDRLTTFTFRYYHLVIVHP